MADEKQNETWPMVKFYFRVKLGDQEVPFQEVSGLETETQIIEYRAGDRKEFAAIKMPGIQKTGNVTLKRGVFVHDNVFRDWYNKVTMNTIQRQTVIISLVDESDAPSMTWTLSNAWPTKISGTGLKSDGNEVAVESIELAFEEMVVENR